MTVPDTRSWPDTRLDLPYPDPVERSTGSRYDYRFGGDDGYDWMADANPRLNFKEIAGWGEDGWDLGNWPYVVISLGIPGLSTEATVLTYVEGDLTFEKFATRDQAFDRVDSAFLFWAEDFVIEELVATIGKVPEALDQVPPRFRSPFQWARIRDREESK